MSKDPLATHAHNQNWLHFNNWRGSPACIACRSCVQSCGILQSPCSPNWSETLTIVLQMKNLLVILPLQENAQCILLQIILALNDMLYICLQLNLPFKDLLSFNTILTVWFRLGSTNPKNCLLRLLYVHTFISFSSVRLCILNYNIIIILRWF